MEKKQLEPPLGTVSLYHRHLFVCFKDAQTWPAQAENTQLDALPARLAAALKSHKDAMPFKVRLTLCEEVDEASRGDVLLFPDSIRYRGLAPEDANSFVEQVLIKGSKSTAGICEQDKLESHYVFICAHGSRDARCGACGPLLVTTFADEINKRNMEDRIQVRACSHVGGHKFAGNVIIFGRTHPQDELLTGHWYGYVTPQDVPTLMDEHIGKGQIVEKLWRGQMCLSEEEQKQAAVQRTTLEVQQDNDRCPCGVSQRQCCKGLPPTKKIINKAVATPWYYQSKNKKQIAAALLVLGIGVLFYYQQHKTG